MNEKLYVSEGEDKRFQIGWFRNKGAKRSENPIDATPLHLFYHVDPVTISFTAE